MKLREALVCFFVLMWVSLAVSTTAQRKQPANTPQPDKQINAEKAADRVMRRFYDTLDFNVIYREMYVSDPLKHKEVRIIIGNLLRQGTPDQRTPLVDLATMERAYIAQGNFEFLVSAQNFTDDGDRESYGKELELNLKPYYMALRSPANWPILTAEKLDSTFTANLNRMNEFLRKHVVSKNFNTDFYQKRIASFKESRPPEEGLTGLFGLQQEIYVVQRERLHLYFIEENGEFKMLSATQRVMD